jgi:methyl-accepting chemotaxis protein
MDSTIISANENFLKTGGYSLAEIQGKHHGMFVEPAVRESTEYREFWAKLNRDEHSAAEYKRIGKGGKEIWILASYNPILDERKRPFKVIKFATDVADQKLSTANLSGQIAAIGKSQAVIEFNMDGTIISANSNLLGAVGYALDEIRGRHHSMFVDPAERDSAAYREFWAALNLSEYQAAEYKRIGKGGKEIWIQASYNPILDLNVGYRYALSWSRPIASSSDIPLRRYRPFQAGPARRRRTFCPARPFGKSARASHSSPARMHGISLSNVSAHCQCNAERTLHIFPFFHD